MIQNVANREPVLNVGPGFHTCIHGRCLCGAFLIKCQMNGVSLLIDRDPLPSATRLAISCSDTKEQHELQKALPEYSFLRKTANYKLENCTELPEILRRPNIKYTGRIRFSGKQIVPEGFFAKSTNLQRLQLEVEINSNRLSVLPAKLFHNLSQLKKLKLVLISRPNDVAIPVEIFHTLFKLESLLVRVYNTDLDEITGTQLHNLTSAYFRDTRKLQSLMLDGNFMQTLAPALFSTLTELTELSLAENELVALPADMLSAQQKLIKLDISHNILKTLPPGIFDTTPLLWELDLTNNQLYMPSNIIKAIKPLRYLYRLNLSQNYFTRIAGTDEYANQTLLSRQHIAELSGAQDLLRYLEQQPNALEQPHNLTLINLSRNRIAQLSLDSIVAAGLVCPYELDFSNNLIQYIYALNHPPRSFTSCLQNLKLQPNPLQCDCTLAWSFSTNFTIANSWDCAGHTRTLSEYSNDVSKMCTWTPKFCPSSCKCTYDSNALHINCSGAQIEGIAELPRPKQFSLTTTTLDIAHNRFYELPSNLTFGYANVSCIYAAHNRITTIQPAHLPPNLTTLDLRNNHLERLSASFLLAYLNESVTLQWLYLSENTWLCDCEAEQLLYTVRTHRLRIPDVEDLYCDNLPNASLLHVPFAEVCATPPAQRMGLMWLLLGVALAIIMLISVLAVYYKYNLEINVWLFARDLCLCCVREHEIDKHKTFDAFISYAHQDEHFVNHVLLPGLEQCVPPFRVCTHERNWLAGAYIPEQIVESVAQSRRTIIVLSQHFVESDWGRMEFRTAHQCSLNEGRARIIIIKFGEITNKSAIDKELRAYLDMNTYLEWEEHPWFWSKLRYAMPHRKGEGRRAGMLELSGDDRREYVVGEVEMNRLR
ncbi:protein toll-like [Anastrepha obliqua]|uniref:protein toll-like n=1 Tax=Anastrepha obliqua TaxID=95512 RepID=UPI002409D0FC|nr:protein toll-like [Anastrepha obliqua]